MILAWLASAFTVEALPMQETSRNSPAAQSYRVVRWTSEDGLPANRVTALAQTRDGYLWIGTWFGLVRFDGVRFVVFNRYTAPALANDAINALAEDSEGNLWIGTADGLVSLREGHFRRYTQADGLPGRKIWRLVQSSSGGIWMQAETAGALWREGRVITRVDLPLGEDNLVRWIGEAPGGELMVAMDMGMITAASGRINGLRPLGGLENASIHGCLLDRGNRYWVSTDHQVARCSEGSWKILQQSPASGPDFFYQDRSGSVWLNRSEAGFWRFEGDRAQSIVLNPRAANQSVESMIEDREGNFWIGAANGLYQLRAKIIQSFGVADGLPDNECRSVSPASDGGVWVETRGGAAHIGQGMASRDADVGRRVPRMSILESRGGTLWVGNGHNGILRVQPGIETNSFWSAASPNGPSGVTLGALYLDRSQRVWVGTSSGATWFEDRRPPAPWGEFGLPTNSIRSIYQSHDATMWFGTWQAGMVRWAPSIPARRFTTADGLADDRVFVFHEDPERVLWIGTHNGLSRFKDGRFFTFRTKEGLLDNLINWFEEDDFGRFWFSCNRGIFCIARKDLNLVAEGKMPRARTAVYGTADGMVSPETNGENQPAGCKDHEGKIWFPTLQGVAMIDPRKLTPDAASPPAVIEEVRANGELIGGTLLRFHASESRPVGSAPRLRPGGAGTLQFRYTVNAFSDPKRVRFRYRLAGREIAWRDETEERTAYYTDLQPGHYRFELDASNPHGVWAESPASFAFSLAPKFTQTFWFPGLCALGLLGLSGTLAVWRLRWQRRVLLADQNARLEGERSRIARDLHDDLGTALTGLALELDVIRRTCRDTPTSFHRLGESAKRTRNLAERMREVVWAVNPRCDTVPSLVGFLEQQAAQFLQPDGIQARFEFPDDIPALPMESHVRHQLALAVREALTNVVRHAKASEVRMSLLLEENTLTITIADNGCGDLPGEPRRRREGNGIGNMRQRLGSVGGSFEMTHGPSGTTVILRVPLQRRSLPLAEEPNAKP